MSYNSYFYLFVFLEAVFLLWLITPRRFRWTVLLLGSYAFYCISSGKRVIFLILSTLSVYLAGLLMNRIQARFDAVRKTLAKEERKLCKAQVKRRKRTVLILALVFNFGLLVLLQILQLFGRNGQCSVGPAGHPCGRSHAEAADASGDLLLHPDGPPAT